MSMDDPVYIISVKNEISDIDKHWREAADFFSFW